MIDTNAFCPSCNWSGHDFADFSDAERRQVLRNLKAGDVMPAGFCPRCRGLSYPGTVHRSILPTVETVGSDRATPEAWRIEIDRLGAAYAIFLVSPHGHGCEVLVEVEGQRPTFALTPFESGRDILEKEPIAHIKAGKDHVVICSADEIGNPVVVTPEGMRATPLMTAEEWAKPMLWDNQPS